MRRTIAGCWERVAEHRAARGDVAGAERARGNIRTVAAAEVAEAAYMDRATSQSTPGQGWAR